MPGTVYLTQDGEMAEWFKAAVLKTAVPETVPGVRIPLPPPMQKSSTLGFRPRPDVGPGPEEFFGHIGERGSGRPGTPDTK